MRSFLWGAVIALIVTGVASPTLAAAPLTSRVNEAFRAAYGRNPSPTENVYWLGRVVRKEKTSFEALLGAMYYHKALGQSTGDVTSGKVNGTTSGDTGNTAQLIKDTLPLFVQIYGSDPSNVEKAWWRKRISCGELKTESELVNAMRYHKTKGVRKGLDTICGQKASAAVSSGKAATKRIAGITNHPMGDQVRIGIYGTDPGAGITVTANSKFQVREGASKVRATLGPEDTVKVTWSGGQYHVRGSGIEIDTPNVIRLVPLDLGIMEVKSYNDKSTTIAGKNYNRFRGIIEVRKCDGCNELWAINELRTEYYLRGLAETSGNGPEEYIKALGVAARTYVLYHKVVTGGRNAARGYTIGRTADDQVYRGYEYEAITPRMSTIFDKTKGIVAADSDGDTPVSTVYFSDSDGRTRSAKEVWGTERFPHLQHSVDDPHHASSSCRGHCVGMSAQGAYGFAKADGWSFDKILNYYFKGITLVKAY